MTDKNVAQTSKIQLYQVGDPEDDLFSDAMDRAVSMYHSVRHGAMRNAERAIAGNTMDGEKLARRALAAGIKAYLEEIGPRAPETPQPASKTLLEAALMKWLQSSREMTEIDVAFRGGWEARAAHETTEQRDAVRYRYLRAHLGDGFAVRVHVHGYLAGPTHLDEALDSAIAERAIKTGNTPKANQPVEREWNFDRYRNGRLMAEGVRVQAVTEVEAWEKAESLKRQLQSPTDELRLSQNGDDWRTQKTSEPEPTKAPPKPGARCQVTYRGKQCCKPDGHDGEHIATGASSNMRW